jgi:hypothetical protein
MLAARSIKPFSPPGPHAEAGLDAVTVLGEVIAELAERIELLELRERITRSCTPAKREAGTVRARE